MRVKILFSSGLSELQDKINEFIQAKDIVGIKYIVDGFYIAIIEYKIPKSHIKNNTKKRG